MVATKAIHSLNKVKGDGRLALKKAKSVESYVFEDFDGSSKLFYTKFKIWMNFMLLSVFFGQI